MNRNFQILKVILFTGGIFIFLPFQDVYANQISSEKIIELVNQDRMVNNVPILLENENLKRAAWQKAEDMLKNDYFAHNSPQGITPWYWIEKSGYPYQYAGENLAINFTDPKEQHAAWMKSPTHRKNILNPNYADIGIAIVRGEIDGRISTIVVQMFGAKKPVLKKEKERILSSTSINPQFEEKKLDRSFSNSKNAPFSKKLEFKSIHKTVPLAEMKSNYFLSDFSYEKIKYLIFILIFILTFANLLFVYCETRHNSVNCINLLIFLAILISFY